MRVFDTKPFARFAKQEETGDEGLCGAVRRAEKSPMDADLGGGMMSRGWARVHPPPRPALIEEKGAGNWRKGASCCPATFCWRRVKGGLWYNRFQAR